jgi:Rrf2 family protein
MPLLPRKGVLAIAAVLDVALHAHNRPVSAKSLADRHALPPRHLEPLLQALVRDGILKGIRGPRGGYQLARERRHISAEEILRAAGTVDELGADSGPEARIVTEVVRPALVQAERAFATVLGRLSVEDLTHQAEIL